jgi:SAM-dependent methyltransferase
VTVSPDLDPIRSSVERYYTGRLAEHGPTHWGADWNSRESQELRFDQLLHVLGNDREFSLVDYGCGYGALAGYLTAHRGAGVRYVGFDISEAMVTTAEEIHLGLPDIRFTSDERSLAPADYAIASGVFNVRLGTPVSEWESYVNGTIKRLAILGHRGFAFNMLTSYSDPEYMREDLYYGDPLRYFDHVKRTYSRHVALLHDYGLYEFTVAVRLEDKR